MPTLISANFDGTTATNWPTSWTAEQLLLHMTSFSQGSYAGAASTVNAQLTEGVLATHFDINGSGGLTTHPETGARIFECAFDVAAPAALSGVPINGSGTNINAMQAIYGIGLTASGVSTVASQKALVFMLSAATGVSPAALTFSVRQWNHTSAGPSAQVLGTALASQSLGNMVQGTTTGRLTVRVVLEPSMMHIHARPNWTAWPASITLTAAQVFAAINVADITSLVGRSLNVYLFVASTATGTPVAQRAALDNFTLNNILPVPIGIVVPPLASLSVHPQPQTQPVGAAESTLTTAATTTTENDSSVSVLSVQPTYALDISDSFQTVDHAYDAGYFASHASATRRRRTWRLSWAALSAADFTTLLALSVATNGNYSSFLWTDPETGEQARCRFNAPLTYQQHGQALYSASGEATEALS